ncbi:MAG: hypothetical protein QOE93_2016 [Actinomycetota bacterium]|jgi:hypothetical protein|nr:hypothetical protein [Actinomycetota bacterium]
MPELTISATSATLLQELRQGMAAEHGDDTSAEKIVDDAIARIHRGFYGLLPGEGGPAEATGPFRKWASDRRAEVLLRQVDAKTFRLAQPFRYDDGTQQFEVPENDVTDLASVPRFLTWLVPRYGRHTLAALVHDHLQASVRAGTMTSEGADEIFRDSMLATGVPLSRRWLMWSAVGLRTQWNLGGLRKLRVFLWAALFGLGALILWPTVAYHLFFTFGTNAVLLAAAAVVGSLAVPLALSVVWGRLWKLGALGGMALMFFTVQIALVLFALGVYVAVEYSVERLFVTPAKRNPVLTRNL